MEIVVHRVVEFGTHEVGHAEDLVMNARAHSAALVSTEVDPRVETEVSLFDRQSLCLAELWESAHATRWLGSRSSRSSHQPWV